MITIVGAYPNRINEKDGMIQRIMAIDTILSSKEREYLDISFKKYLIKKEEARENTTVYRVNFFIYFWFILYKISIADVIYVHSIYNSIKVILIYFMRKKIITDMHGVVVEEMKMLGQTLRAKIYRCVERIVINRSTKVIVVTNEMKKYFQKEYSVADDKYLTISIFTNRTICSNNKKENVAIYAGGTQKWQRIPDLLELIKKTKESIDWIILTNDLKSFDDVKKIVYLKTVSPDQVFNYYEKATYGMILRLDDIVNNVACPTKLIEYIQAGLVPVVITPNIGDFLECGYRYVTYEAFMRGDFPSFEEIKFIRTHNKEVLSKIMMVTNKNIDILVDIFREKKM